MKKTISLIMSVLMLCACATTQKADNTTIQSTTTQSTTVSTTTKQTSLVSTTVSATTTTVQKSVAKMIDYDAIQRGDFSSVAGKWRNQAGNEIVFTEEGFENSDTQISSFAIQEGILYANVYSVKEKTGYALNFVKRGMKISDKLFYQGSDNSDIDRDRLFGAQAKISADKFDPFYRVDD